MMWTEEIGCQILTTRVVGGGQEDTAGCLLDANDVRGGRGGEDAILSDDQLLDTVCSTNLCNQLGDLGVPVAAITTNDEERVLDALGDGEEDGSDKGLGVVVLLEDLDLFTKTGATDCCLLANV